MTEKSKAGLGELLRYLLELTDGSSVNWYKEQGLNYRPRYPPVMRALMNGALSVAELQGRLSVTQGAVSQTIKLMLADKLIVKNKGKDARQSIVSLSEYGKELLQELEPHWNANFKAINTLESEIQFPLMQCLIRTGEALEKRAYAERINDARKVGAAVDEEGEKHFFNSNGESYAKYRPSYPPELALALADLVSNRELALDIGCGNGQLTSFLATYFSQVIGIDPNESQLNQADSVNNISYFQQAAEDIRLPDNSVDLIVTAQAAHWFDLEQFYSEARRVGKQDAVIALVSYGVPYIFDPVNSIFQQGYWQDVHEFWPAERVHVENGYTELYFPFPLINFPQYYIREEMTIDRFIHYMMTWSAYSNACKKGEKAKFEIFFNKLRAIWMEKDKKEVVWPVIVRAAPIHKKGD